MISRDDFVDRFGGVFEHSPFVAERAYDHGAIAEPLTSGGVHTALYHELPHGVIGAMLLKELGFPHTVVSTVATHATNAPFHGRNPEAHVLHYADLFAADHAFRVMGETPLYLRRH